MCGIFGAIGKYDKDKLKILAIMNEDRGRDSFGVYRRPFNKKTGVMYKVLDKPKDILHESKMNMYLKSDTGVFLGHTRYATRGDKNQVKNAHPFIYGNIIGTHNGIINNVDDLEQKYDCMFDVDSESIFYLLDKEQSHKKVFAELEGYWGLAWVDKTDPTSLYLTKHNNTLYYVRLENKAIYYSSDMSHLKLITGNRGDGKIQTVTEDQVVRIDRELKIKLFKKYKAKEKVYTPYVYPTKISSKSKDTGLSSVTKSSLFAPSEDTKDVIDRWQEDFCDFCGVDILDTDTKEFFYYEGAQLCRDCAKYAITEFQFSVYTEFGDKVTIKNFEKEV